MELKNYFEETLNLISSQTNYKNDSLKIAGRNILIKSSSQEIQELFLPSLSHLAINDPVQYDLTIWSINNNDLSKKIKAPEWKNIDFNVQGFALDLNQEDYQIFFQPWIRQMFLYSRKHKTGIYWVNSIDEVPWWEPTFSFRVIFHFWTRDLPAQLIHSGAIAIDNGDAWLITGPSGSGKSTTCMNLLRAGYKYLGDDYVWVENSRNPSVHALYQTAKLEPDNFHERFYDWKSGLINKETYRDRKAIFLMREIVPQSWLNKARLKGIIIPKVTGKEFGKIRLTKPTLALLAMAPTTLHHLPHHRQVAYEKMKDISMKLNNYEWLLGSKEFECELNFKHFLQNEYTVN